MKSMRFGRRGVLKGATATAALMGTVRASFPAGALAQGLINVLRNTLDIQGCHRELLWKA